MSKYFQRGVSSKKEDVHNAIAELDKGLFLNSFCKILPDTISKSKNHYLLMHADGAGTKSALAYVYWKETNDLSVWEGIAQDAIVMNTDDLLCVGAVDDFVISSTIGRNQKKIPSQVIKSLIHGTESFLETLRSYGINIANSGGETADLGDLIRTIVVDSSIVGRIEKDKIIDNANISDGDVIVGLASFGQANYETQYNSGMGCNGLTSARHDLFNEKVRRKYPESFDQEIPSQLVYSGSHYLTDSIKEYQTDFGKFVLSPTRTYLPIVKSIFENIDRKKIHGIIHCTGGGQTKVLNFIDDLYIVKDNLFPTPKLFELIKSSSKSSMKEMYQVFNMGHRLEFYTDLDIAQQLIQISKSFSVDARIIGRVEKRHSKGLEIISEDGSVFYS
ncbi:MAG: AIR synthase-related protein [Flavobacteriaceae bacterium]|nr:AIR synthase-related protein [Flavobacteriaceae bacterium]MCY4266914.1 AIR synthase-related protein [Flavobacteriaceae bacterium]MCY4298689.1 AIR synthase-related protein [Flavobacteriaceae bacterium]